MSNFTFLQHTKRDEKEENLPSPKSRPGSWRIPAKRMGRRKSWRETETWRHRAWGDCHEQSRKSSLSAWKSNFYPNWEYLSRFAQSSTAMHLLFFRKIWYCWTSSRGPFNRLIVERIERERKQHSNPRLLDHFVLNHWNLPLPMIE